MGQIPAYHAGSNYSFIVSVRFSELMIDDEGCEDTPVVRDVLEVMYRVLEGGGRLSLEDNFFNRGGNSLNAVMAVTALRDLGYTVGEHSRRALTQSSDNNYKKDTKFRNVLH